ncbi:hypothetical protein B0H16DRAFT_1466692 [Mycena metata]|uniref:GATA-type domain-containing protein n=1 Tax=Mycena metata TaxID=1033252 RepID=A0AAD7I6M5_9AGAR|nr:hypothetical protein B0H16DRAFT_1466692 [Mycena metata]
MSTPLHTGTFEEETPQPTPCDHSARASTPPPIATLPHAASPSPPSNGSAVGRSSVSTTPVVNPARRSPPQSQQQQHHHAAPPPPARYAYDMQHFPPGNYVYGPPQPQPPQYTRRPHRARMTTTIGLMPMRTSTTSRKTGNRNTRRRTALTHSTLLPEPRPPFPLVTDDAGTKLSDRVWRRCFNCCTMDTATWRRSNLNPGKILCNKCGLFERTHSRSRPQNPVLQRANSRPAKQQHQQSHQPYPPPTASIQQQQPQPHPAPYRMPIPALAGTGLSASTSTTTSSSQNNQNNAITSNGGPMHNGQQNGTPSSSHQNGASHLAPHPDAVHGHDTSNANANANANATSGSGSPGSPDVDFLRVEGDSLKILNVRVYSSQASVHSTSSRVETHCSYPILLEYLHDDTVYFLTHLPGNKLYTLGLCLRSRSSGVLSLELFGAVLAGRFTGRNSAGKNCSKQWIAIMEVRAGQYESFFVTASPTSTGRVSVNRTQSLSVVGRTVEFYGEV